MRVGRLYKVKRKNGYIFILVVFLLVASGTVFALVYYHQHNQTAQATQSQTNKQQEYPVSDLTEEEISNLTIPEQQLNDNQTNCSAEESDYRLTKQNSDYQYALHQQALADRVDYRVLLERSNQDQTVADMWAEQQRDRINQSSQNYQEAHQKTQAAYNAWAQCKQATYQQWLDSLHQ